ncbi:MAG TPA: hypothetical protein VG942_12690 [Hyphomonadaceae bacterium]|nr:hypothetical protein [Hyphomonadaceae bacterium]
MLCCLLAAVFSGNLAVAGRIAVGFVKQPSAMKIAMLGGAGLLGAVLAPMAAAHVGHYAERAKLNDRSILEEILAAPICSGAVNHGTKK